MPDRPDLDSLLAARFGSVAAASRAANLNENTLRAALKARSAGVRTVRNIADAYARSADDYAVVLAYFGLTYLPDDEQ